MFVIVLAEPPLVDAHHLAVGLLPLPTVEPRRPT